MSQNELLSQCIIWPKFSSGPSEKQNSRKPLRATACIQTGGCVFILLVWVSLHIWLTVITIQFFFGVFFSDASLIPSSLKQFSPTSVLLFSICIRVLPAVSLLNLPQSRMGYHIKHLSLYSFSFQPYQVNMDKQQMQIKTLKGFPRGIIKK